MSPLPAMIGLLAVFCFCSALAVAYTTHLTRQTHSQISVYQRSADTLNEQWSRLKIEESTFSEYSLIERKAADELNMRFPGLDQSIMITR